MFKFCNKCYLCQKYYNENAEFKNYGSYQKMLPKFINGDYELIHRSNEILTEEYMVTSGDKGLPIWYLYEDEFIYSCSGSILKGVEGNTSSWNGVSSNNNLSSYFITNYGKVLYIQFIKNLNKFRIHVKYPALKGRGNKYCYSPINHSNILLNKTKINQDTLNNINYLYEIPGLFIHKDNNQKFNIDIIYSIIHTYKSSQNEENLDILYDTYDKYIDLKQKYNLLKDKFSDLYNLYKQNLDKLKYLDNKHNNINNNSNNNNNNISNAGKMALLRNKVKINKKCDNNNNNSNNSNIFLNPRTWD